MPSQARISTSHGRKVKSRVPRTKRAARRGTRNFTDDETYQPAKSKGQSRKMAVKPRKGIFRFLDLPYDIKRDIYDLCLISSIGIVVSIDLSNGGNGIEGFDRDQGADYDDLVDLTSNHSSLAFTRNSQADSHPYFNVNILLTSKALYAEAMPVLYSQNTFVFHGESGLDAFILFQQRLTEISRNSLRRLHLKFPQIWRDCTYAEDGHYESCETLSHTFDEWPVEAVNGLKGLRSFHLRLDQDLLVEDIALLERFSASSGATGRLILEIDYNKIYISRFRRRARIPSDVVEKILEWGWEIVGELDRMEYDT